MRNQGTTSGVAGKAPIKPNGKTVGTVILAIVGALLLGVGMSLSMVFGKLVLGVVIGLIGIVALLMLIPHRSRNQRRRRCERN